MAYNSSRARKREQDRVYQQRRREREKGLVASLKQRIKTLEDQALQKQPPLATGEQQTTPATSGMFEFNLEDPPEPTAASHYSSPESLATSSTTTTLPYRELDCAVRDESQSASTKGYAVFPFGPSELPELPGNSLTPVSIPARWVALSDSIHKANVPDPEDEKLPSAADFDAHIIISGVVHGWEAVAQLFKFTAVWECLRTIDTLSLQHSSLVGRMAALRVVALILRSQSPKGDPDRPLPRYLWPRPSQLSLPHPAHIDYFIWPGFRERMVFHYARYAYESFGQKFSQSYKFLWPHPPNTAYVRLSSSPFYRFSDDFLVACDDIRCYRMDSDFLNLHPEFYADVPVVGGIPDMVDPGFSWVFNAEEDNKDEVDGKRNGLVLARKWSRAAGAREPAPVQGGNPEMELPIGNHLGWG